MQVESLVRYQNVYLGNVMYSAQVRFLLLKYPSGALSLDDEAVKIIEEATAVVEENTRDKFPDLPTQNSE